MKMKESRGLTMIEMVVVLAVIAILAAILTPIATSYVERARVNAAANDVKKIAAAIIQFDTDTKFWPIYSTTTGAPSNITTNINDYECSAGSGAIKVTSGAGQDWPTLTDCPTNHGDLDAILNKNNMGLPRTGKTAWKGAYTELASDPWGTQYYINSKYLTPGCLVATHANGGASAGSCAFGSTGTPAAVYVISAGPNQTIETGYDQDTNAFSAGGDDIVGRIR